MRDRLLLTLVITRALHGPGNSQSVYSEDNITLTPGEIQRFQISELGEIPNLRHKCNGQMASDTQT